MHEARAWIQKLGPFFIIEVESLARKGEIDNQVIALRTQEEVDYFIENTGFVPVEGAPALDPSLR